jgi:hypothetical protein
MNGPTPIQKRLLILKLRADHPDLTVRAIALRVGVNEKTAGHILRQSAKQKRIVAPTNN